MIHVFRSQRPLVTGFWWLLVAQPQDGPGAAYADDHHNMNLLYAGDQPNALRTSQGRSDLAGQLQEFVDAIHEQRQATVTLKDSMRAIAVTKQIIKSASSNHVIEQKEDN